MLSLLFVQKLKVAALRMYTCCVEKTDYEEFFNSKCWTDGV